MLINYGSFMYCAYILLAVVVCAILYAILKNRSHSVKKGVVFTIALFNFLQHVLKLVIYPQYAQEKPIYLITAYNVCAFLIILSPFIILFGNRLLQNFITYMGSFAGMIAMVVPYWFIGKSAFGWEVYRFYICHSLLFISSILPGLIGLHTLEKRHCWKIGLLFIGVLVCVLLNDTVLILTNAYPNTHSDNVYEALSRINPCWTMHPAEGMAWVGDIVALFSPAFFFGNNPWNVYIPVLWYAIPLYLGITLLTYLLYAATEKIKGFVIKQP